MIEHLISFRIFVSLLLLILNYDYYYERDITTAANTNYGWVIICDVYEDDTNDK